MRLVCEITIRPSFITLALLTVGNFVPFLLAMKTGHFLLLGLPSAITIKLPMECLYVAINN